MQPSNATTITTISTVAVKSSVLAVVDVGMCAIRCCRCCVRVYVIQALLRSIHRLMYHTIRGVRRARDSSIGRHLSS